MFFSEIFLFSLMSVILNIHLYFWLLLFFEYVMIPTCQLIFRKEKLSHLISIAGMNFPFLSASPEMKELDMH